MSFRRHLMERSIKQGQLINWNLDSFNAENLMELTGEITSNIRKVFKTDICTLMLREDHKLEIISTDGVGNGSVEHRNIPIGHSLSGRVFKRGEPHLWKDVTGYLNSLPDNMEGFYRGSLAVTPLVYGNKQIGLLSVCNLPDSTVLTYEDLNRLVSYGSQIAFAIETQKKVEDKTKELLEMKNALQEVNEVLEQTVEKRTAQLASLNSELINDIKKRKKIEEALTMTNNILQVQQEVALDGIIIFNDNNQIIFNNRKFLEMWEISQNDLATNTNAELRELFLSKVIEENEIRKIIMDLFYSKVNKSTREIFLKGGSVLKAYSSPIIDEKDNYYGRVWYFTDITDQKRADEALRHSNAILKTQQETALDGILVLDENGSVISCNSRFLSMWEMPENLRSNLSKIDIFHELTKKLRDSGQFSQSLKELIEKIGDKHFETMYLPDGRVFEFYSASLGEYDESIKGRVCYFRDITERKMAEMELNRYHDRLQDMVREATGELSETNRRLENEIIEKKTVETKLRESERKLRVKLDYIMSPEKGVEEFLLTDLFDIDDIQQIQDAFARTAEISSIITDTRGNPITEPSNFGGVCSLINRNEQGKSLCIMTRQQMIPTEAEIKNNSFKKCPYSGFYHFAAPLIFGGKHIANWCIGQAYVDDINESYITKMADKIGATRDEMMEAYKNTKRISREKFESIIKLLILLTKEISTLGYKNLSLARNNTQLKLAEEKLQNYADKLRESNNELKSFAYIVSHDLRAPLVNLKGFAGELRYSTDMIVEKIKTCLPHIDEDQRGKIIKACDEDIPEAYTFIDSSVNRMDNLIKAILKLSRLGRRELNYEKLELSGVVNGCLKTLHHQIEKEKIEIRLHDLLNIVADKPSLEQILDNLLVNAIKYLRPGVPGVIEIYSQKENDYTIIHIRDNGRGIEEKDIDKIFELFKRAGKRDTPGEGMGLAYVKTLVRRHGGRIWCESEPLKGSRFSFTISDTLVQGGIHE